MLRALSFATSYIPVLGVSFICGGVSINDTRAQTVLQGFGGLGLRIFGVAASLSLSLCLSLALYERYLEGSCEALKPVSINLLWPESTDTGNPLRSKHSTSALGPLGRVRRIVSSSKAPCTFIVDSDT